MIVPCQNLKVPNKKEGNSLKSGKEQPLPSYKANRPNYLQTSLTRTSADIEV